MPENTTRPRRLKQRHYDAARHLDWIECGVMRANKGQRQSVTRRLNQLANLAGVDPTGLKPAALYLESIRALLARGEEDHPEAEILRERLNRIEELNRERREEEERREEQVKQAAKLPDTKPTRPTGQARIPDEKYKSLDLMPHDLLHAELCDDPQPGDLLVMWEKDGEKGWHGVGRFIGYEEDEDGWREYQIEEEDGEPYCYRVDLFNAYRAVTITRTRRVEHGNPAESERERKLKRLRRRLETLGDDITDTSAQFRLEKQIHDLEREARADEWPEYVNA